MTKLILQMGELSNKEVKSLALRSQSHKAAELGTRDHAYNFYASFKN